MKAVDRRVTKLEEQIGCRKRPGQVVIVCDGREPPLDHDSYLRILEESGHFDPEKPCGVVNFYDFPRGLNAQETERFLREHGAELIGLKPLTD